jgi:saccharopine dehydrogenase-like NADP-dependent oxidoreductase
MSRTTGYTATAVANFMLDISINKTGILPLELLGGDEAIFDYIMDYLGARNISISEST